MHRSNKDGTVLTNPSAPSNAIPGDVLPKIQLLREYADVRGVGSASEYLAEYIAGGRHPNDVADRMLAIRDALGHDAKGGAAFDQVLDQGQSPSLGGATSFYSVAQHLRGAYVLNVERGAIGTSDVRGMVDREALLVKSNTAEPQIGTDNPGLTERFGRLSSYVDALSTTSPEAMAVREAFVERSLEHASQLRGSSPLASAQLYAQAANAMADMSASDIARHLDALRRNDPDGVAHFAAGALSGEAERAIDRTALGEAWHETFRADGLAAVIATTTEDVRRATAAGHPDVAAQRTNAELFTGATAFLSAARGTILDRALGDRDVQTGMREALNGAVEHNFPAILKANSQSDGQGLDTGKGFETIASYSRFQFGAPNDEHGRQTTAHAEAVVGQLIGTLQGDLLKAGRDDGADLRRDFGENAFGDHRLSQKHAARITGEIMGSIENGINQDFDVRADRHANDQAVNRNSFEAAATIANLAGLAVNEKAGPVLDIAESVFQKLSDAAPQQLTSDTGRVGQIDALSNTFQNALATHRPGTDLSIEMQDGRIAANDAWITYETARDHFKTNDNAAKSQEGLLSGILLKTITPAPPEPVPVSPQAAHKTPEALLLETQKAVRDYNADPSHRTPLPVPVATPDHPQPVTEWDHRSHKGGTVLKLAENEYAYHTGQGRYQVFTPADTLGVHPIPDQMATLGADGTIHQAPPAAHENRR